VGELEKDIPDNLCVQCGSDKTHANTINYMGEPWKVVINCEVCGAASIGKTKEDAEKKFSEGNFDLEVENWK
jgi:hypothetical protein